MTSSLLPLALCVVFVLIHSTEAWKKIIETRAKVLAKIDANSTSEDRLYFDRCRQSSVSDSCVLAIDDTINQEPWSNECAVTSPDYGPWWEGRLEAPSYVSRVLLYTLGDIIDTGRDAFLEFELKAGSHVCTRFSASVSFLNKTFACDTFTDVIRIQSLLWHSVLALCEIEIYGKAVVFARNIEPYKNGEVPLRPVSCMGSSVATDGSCYYAIDQDTSQDPEKSKCAASQWQPAPYFEFQLPGPALVRYVTVWHRRYTDEKMEMFEISVNGQVCIRFDVGIEFSEKKSPCNRFGSVVRFSTTSNFQRLTLCEIEILGYPIQFFERQNNKYLGCYKEKKQRRDMQQLGGIGRMSPEKCARICSRHKMPFFGLQQGKQCWCSERYGRYGMAAEDACWMKCDYSEHETCGAKMYNSIYEVVGFEENNSD